MNSLSPSLNYKKCKCKLYNNLSSFFSLVSVTIISHLGALKVRYSSNHSELMAPVVHLFPKTQPLFPFKLEIQRQVEILNKDSHVLGFSSLWL